MKYFILLLTICSTYAGCPSVCRCTNQSVICVQQDINGVPSFESLQNNPAIIDLSGNRLTEIDNDDFSFDASEYVQEVYLNSSEIADIDENAFIELKSLQQLYLQDNFLTGVPENIVESNTNLILLNLSKNHFRNMPKIASNSIEILAMADSKISIIGNNVLDNLPSLRILIIKQNFIKELSVNVFQTVKSPFIVSITQNPWICNCRTIDTFDYLISKKFIDKEESVACLNSNKYFVNIYENDIVQQYKDKCASNADRDTLFSGSLIKTEKEDIKGDLKQTSNLIEVEEDFPIIENITEYKDNGTCIYFITNHYGLEVTLVFIITSSIVLCSFFLGFYFGRRNSEYIVGTTESSFKLILP